MGARTSKQIEDALALQQDDSITLAWEQMKSIPDAIFKHTNLKTLVLDFNRIAEIPGAINSLTHLQELSIAANKLNSLPHELTHLTNLTKLNVGLNRLTKIKPSLFHHLTKLQELYIDANPVNMLHEDICRLTNLKVLSVSQNGLQKFFQNHPDFSFPKSLDSLKLMGNYLTQAPTLLNMNNLTLIDLNENRLQKLPASLTSLHSLKRLFISCNELDSLPAGFGAGWPELVTLHMAFNNFKTLPEEFSELKKLSYVDVRGNGLPIKLVGNSRIESVSNLMLMLHGEDPQTVPHAERITVELDSPKPDLILPNVYLGCYECAKNKLLLQELKITHVLTVARFQPLYPSTFTYKVVEIDDANSEDIFAHFETCIKFIESATTRGNVLIHCRAGVSRSASVVSAYVMQNQQLTRDKAIEYVKARRSRILPNEGFYDQLGKWEKRLGLTIVPVQ